MSALEMYRIDLEQGTHRQSAAGSDDGSCHFSDAEDGSCYSRFYSTRGGSYDDYSFGCVSDAEIIVDDVVLESRRVTSASSDCSVEVEIKVHSTKVEGDCRICHMGLVSNSHESGVAIELGCSCKNDLAAAHKQCAEAWFKIKGNKRCEICHSIARNVAGTTETESIQQLNEANNVTAVAAVSASVPPSETRGFWHGHRFLNFLLACVVFAFVLSWLFHFNVPTS